MIACADYGLGETREMPGLLDLAISCEEYKVLPVAGGVLDQPAGLVRKMRQAMNVYRAHRMYKDEGQKPGESAKWKKQNAEVWEIVSWVDGLREQHG